MTVVEVGSMAPEFVLPGTAGEVRLSGFRGKQNVVLYFYPKDDTAVCTLEAQAMRDNMKAFEKLRAQVVGISADSVESHKKFEKKHKLNFPLLADTTRKVIRAYDVEGEKSMFGHKYIGIKRMSYLIDPSGKIVTIYESVRAREHADQVLKELKEKTAV